MDLWSDKTFTNYKRSAFVYCDNTYAWRIFRISTSESHALILKKEILRI